MIKTKYLLGVLAVLTVTFPDLSSAEVVRTVREAHPVQYQVVTAVSPLRASSSPEWLTVHRVGHAKARFEVGNRIVVGLADESIWPTLEGIFGVQRSRQIEPGLWVVQAESATAALDIAAQLAGWPGINLSYPVQRRKKAKREAYAPLPNDPYFPQQAHLDQRDSSGNISGPSLNVRSAWPFATGKGVVVAVGDEGVDLGHPDLAAHATGPHFNFFTDLEDGNPYGDNADHGTAVAGLALAVGFNKVGVTGAAPEASLASWVVLGDVSLTDQQTMQMYQYKSNLVSVQNHSWGFVGQGQFDVSPLEDLGVENAYQHGRQGRGVVLVRAGGNSRLSVDTDFGSETAAVDANDEAETSDRRVIAVAAVRQDGQVASYSTRGACLLVAAPGGEGPSDPILGLVTTDRRGSDGYNIAQGADDPADYLNYTLNVTDQFGAFAGTSASSPLIAGVVALILQANPLLTVRDVQQVLVLSAKPSFANDPDMSTNGAGLRVSHNLGFGVPDAGDAVRLARQWTNRPAQMMVTRINNTTRNVPEVPLVRVEGVAGLVSTPAFPSIGKDNNVSTPSLDLVDLGFAMQTDARNLAGKIALIERGTNFFREKLANAAAMGAQAAIIFNNRTDTNLLNMGLVDDASIPAVFISRSPGLAMREAINQGQSPKVRLAGIDETNALVTEFTITEQMICEHVGIYVDANFPRRGDLRISVVSPAGTVSRMQNLNYDDDSGPTAWTYYSTHHFFEGTPGKWKVLIHDQQPGHTGQIRSVGLTLYGTPIMDSDGDGLDDNWEQAHFHSLSQGPKDDPDKDGTSNMREQLLGTDPLKPDTTLELSLAAFDNDTARLSWPGRNGVKYEVWTSPSIDQPLTKLTQVTGAFPYTEWVSPWNNAAERIYQVRVGQ